MPLQAIGLTLGQYGIRLVEQPEKEADTTRQGNAK